MWVFTPIGFFSVVAHRDKKKTVMVRARCKADLTTFRKKYCKRLKAIRFLDWSDYPYRAECSRWAFAHAMFKIALDLTYTNFKSAVGNNPRHNLYMGVWSKLRDGERSGGFGPEIQKVRKKGGRGYGTYGGHRYTPSSSVASRPMPVSSSRPQVQGNLFDDLHDPRAGDLVEDDEDPNSWGWGNTEVIREEDLTDEELRQCENPFFWQDDTGRTSDDDPSEPMANSREGVMEFDSINDVIDHFKKKD